MAVAQNGRSTRDERAFNFYFDRVYDARKMRLRRTTADRPKMPLARLPTAPVRTIRLSAVVVRPKLSQAQRA